MDKQEELISAFRDDQSLEGLQKMRNAGIQIKELKNNKWTRMTRYKLPLDRFVPLYNDDFKIDAIGVY